MNLLERNEFIKASPVIQIQSDITRLQRRVWSVLLANAYDELPNKDVYRISIVELAGKLGFDSKNQKYLEEALKGLVDHTVEWSILSEGKKQVWGVASLLVSAEIENGICTYGLAPHLRYKLYTPRIYTKLKLRLQNRFMSRYALILWEVCFDYFDTALDQGITPFIPLEKLREWMGLETDDYPIFTHLNRRVIEPAIKEIKELTNFFVEVERKCEGRKVAFLKFRILKLKQGGHSEPESLYPDVEGMPALANMLVQAGITQREAVKIANQEWNTVDAEVVMEDYRNFAEYVDEKIAFAQQVPNVQNVSGFIVQAIRENYQNPVFQEEFKACKEQERQAMLKVLESELREKQNALLRQAVRMNPELLERAAKRIKSYFVLECLAHYNSLHEAYRDEGIVAMEINCILAENFCQDLIAPIVAAYEDEKARLLGEVG